MDASASVIVSSESHLLSCTERRCWAQPLLIMLQRENLTLESCLFTHRKRPNIINDSSIGVHDTFTPWNPSAATLAPLVC